MVIEGKKGLVRNLMSLQKSQWIALTGRKEKHGRPRVRVLKGSRGQGAGDGRHRGGGGGGEAEEGRAAGEIYVLHQPIMQPCATKIQVHRLATSNISAHPRANQRDEADLQHQGRLHLRERRGNGNERRVRPLSTVRLLHAAEAH